jgi:hypothetical protein
MKFCRLRIEESVENSNRVKNYLNYEENEFVNKDYYSRGEGLDWIEKKIVEFEKGWHWRICDFIKENERYIGDVIKEAWENEESRGKAFKESVGKGVLFMNKECDKLDKSRRNIENAARLILLEISKAVSMTEYFNYRVFD